MAIKTINKDVACSCFVTRSIEPQRHASGFVSAAPKTNLVALSVKADYSTLGLVTGDIVYVPQEYCNSAWGKRVLTVDGVGEFILVPAEHIFLVRSS